MQDTESLRQALDCKLHKIRLEVMLYSLPDDFTVYIDYDGKQLKKPHRVTRNKKQYELSSSPTI